MPEREQSNKRWLHGATIGVAILLVGAFSISPRTPQSDEFVYLGYAFGLAKYGIFGLVTSPTSTEPPPSTSRIGPLVPATHALAMSLSSNFYAETQCLLGQKDRRMSRCSHTSVLSHYLQLLLWAVSLTWVALQLARLSGGFSLAYLTTAFIFVSGAPFEYIAQFNSEGLYLPVFFVFLVALGRAVTEDSYRYWIVAALALGLCALARPVFFYLFWMLLPLMLVGWWLGRRRSRARFRPGGIAIFIAAFMLLIGPWLARNVLLYGSPTLTVGYSVGTLSYRIAYNSMTTDEYLAGWVYWLPDFGDSLAARLFDETSYRRLDLGYEDGIHRAGSRRIQAEITSKTGSEVSSYTRESQRTSSGWVFREYIVADWWNHLKVTALLFWRGVLLNSYFGLIGFPLVIWAVAIGLKGPHRLLFLLSLGITSLLTLFYAFISLNIARYSAPMILPMSLAYAALIQCLVPRLRNENELHCVRSTKKEPERRRRRLIE